MPSLLHLLLTLILALSSSNAILSPMRVVSNNDITVLDLDGTWALSNQNGSVSTVGIVPGQVHTDLMRQKLIPHPYFQDNDQALRWIAWDNWTYSREFDVSEEFLNANKILLILDGVETVANVSINGHAVGHTRSMFVAYTFDVKPYLHAGSDNTVTVAFESSASFAARQSRKYPYPAPETPSWFIQTGERWRNFVRMKASDFSWDWAPCFLPSGLYLPARLVAYSSLRVDWASVLVEGEPDGGFIVHTEAEVDSSETGGLISVEIEGLGIRNQASFTGNSASVSLFVADGDVERWWPHTDGKPVLYTAKVSVCAPQNQDCTPDTADPANVFAKRVGFRTVELVQDPLPGHGTEEGGATFFFRVNGVDIFAKGSNVVPLDSFEARSTPEAIESVLRTAVDANMNMLRVWGGGIYQREAFYDLADEVGVMVWQEFMFACAVFPVDEPFLDLVRAEVKYQARRLLHHASVVLWSGSNENEEAFEWFHETRANPKRYAVDFDKLYVVVVRDTLVAIDNVRPFWISSPSNGIVSKDPYSLRWGDANGVSYGDTHFYSYVESCTKVTGHYPTPRFASEYGFQSLPFNIMNETLPEDWKWDSPMMEHRQHHLFGEFTLSVQMARHFRLPNNPDKTQSFIDYIYVSQCMQSLCVESETQHYRRGRHSDAKTMGSLVWMLRDIWPAPSWATVEYGGGEWKLAHYALKRAFADFTVSTFVDESNIVDPKLSVWGVSDSHAPSTNGTLVITVREWSSAETRLRKSIPFELDAFGGQELFGKNVALLFIEAEALPEHCVVQATASVWRGNKQANAEAVWFPVDLALADLPTPNISLSNIHLIANDTVSLVVGTTAMAAFVSLKETSGVRGRFSDSGFLLVPGEDRTVEFFADQPIVGDVSFGARSIRDSYV